ncbi:MAG: 4-hydroxythreonine-4-phosphate dehydrogenase PdxA [Ignavibacteria bacterium]|nr:4-hydroxythreonine-4-phosphate dehydrogenase PdxA [Ignavibacteria bacterium]
MSNNTAKKPRLLVTTGDPNGIGPEIILKIFNNKSTIKGFELTAVGSKKVFDFYSKLLKLNAIPSEKIIEIPLPKNFDLKPGKIDKKAGKFSGDAVKTAIELCLRKEFDGLVTLPISKESFNLGGYNYPGHTEMLTEMASSGDTAMILYSEEFSVSPVTGHIPVSDVSKRLNQKLLFKKIIAVNNSLVKDFKVKNPKMAILSLNPHAGDGGLIGNEEQNIITPVIEEMNSIGFNLRGPFASDAFFANKSYKKFDITIAMYHDQGLIPFKMISFDSGVNFTAGLNIIRTSPDHGTAFDIAGLGVANPESSLQAVELAGKLAGS